MAFQFCELDESEQREYTLTMFPHYGDKRKPGGGIIDFENDIRLCYYGNGPYTEPCDEYQFIFDYKGTAMNINIHQKIEGNDIYYSLIAVEGNGQLCIDEIKPSLREAIRLFGIRRYASGVKNNPDMIHVNF